MVFDNTDFRVVNSRTQKEAYVFAPATLKSVTYGYGDQQPLHRLRG